MGYNVVPFEHNSKVSAGPGHGGQAVPVRPKEQIPVVSAYAMAWLTSIFILDVLNMVSCFGYSMLSMVGLSIIASIRAVMSSFHFLWKILLSSSFSSSSYKVL